MSAENVVLCKRWFEEVWNQGREDSLDAMCALDGVAHSVQSKPIVGSSAFKDFVRTLRGALPDIRIDIADTIAEGSKVVLRCRVTGHHTGASLGVPPTSKFIQFEGVTIMRIEQGLIVEGWDFYDILRLYTEIGLVKFVTV